MSATTSISFAFLTKLKRRNAEKRRRFSQSLVVIFVLRMNESEIERWKRTMNVSVKGTEGGVENERGGIASSLRVRWHMKSIFQFILFIFHFSTNFFWFGSLAFSFWSSGMAAEWEKYEHFFGEKYSLWTTHSAGLSYKHWLNSEIRFIIVFAFRFDHLIGSVSLTLVKQYQHWKEFGILQDFSKEFKILSHSFRSVMKETRKRYEESNLSILCKCGCVNDIKCQRMLWIKWVSSLNENFRCDFLCVRRCETDDDDDDVLRWVCGTYRTDIHSRSFQFW